MSKKRKALQQAKNRKRTKRFKESGGEGKSKYALKHKAQKGGRFTNRSPFVAVKSPAKPKEEKHENLHSE